MAGGKYGISYIWMDCLYAVWIAYRKNIAVENQVRSRETAGEKGEVWRTKEAPSGTDFF